MYGVCRACLLTGTPPPSLSLSLSPVCLSVCGDVSKGTVSIWRLCIVHMYVGMCGVVIVVRGRMTIY